MNKLLASALGYLNGLLASYSSYSRWCSGRGFTRRGGTLFGNYYRFGWRNGPCHTCLRTCCCLYLDAEWVGGNSESSC